MDLSGAVQPAYKRTIVSIDFGTYGSGFAFAANRPNEGFPEVKLHERWPGLGADIKYPKTLTAVLYRGRTPVAFGYEALTKLHKVPAPEQAQYTLVRNFKTELLSPGSVRLPPGVPVEQVIADYLSWIRRYSKDKVAAELGAAAAQPDAIQWCLTVPAMWREDQKQTMRRAARRAGFIRDEDDQEGLAIILEPEAAALDALAKQAPPLRPGDHVMVLDAGGGTVDITVHECVARSGHVVLDEKTSADGGHYGSTTVDANFESYYREQVGGEAFDTWVEAYPGEWLQVTQKFEVIKRAFGEDAVAASTSTDDFSPSGPVSTIFIPPNLHRLMRDDDCANLKVTQGVDTDVMLAGSTLKDLFEVPVNETLKLAKNQLDVLQQAGQRCNKVLMVGGFSESKYLQRRVRDELERGGLVDSVIVPPHPASAVLEGAVVYGNEPELIRMRCSRYAYGVATCRSYTQGAPVANKFWHDEECSYYTKNVFKRFVDKNQQVQRDEEVLHYFNPLYSHQTSVTIPIYAADRNNIRFVKDGNHEVEDVEHMADLVVCLPDGVDDIRQRHDGVDDVRQRNICVKFLFGRTEITASAWDEESGQPVSVRRKFKQNR